MKRYFLVFLAFSAFILMGCGPERLLKKAEIYIKGSPPVEIMTPPNPAGPQPVDADPMKYSTVLTQYVEEAFKLEGFLVTYLPMEENFQPTTSGQFLVEVMMAMIEEQAPLIPDPANPATMGLKVNLTSVMMMVDKEGNQMVKDYQHDFDMSPEAQAEAIGGDPDADIHKLVLQNAAKALAKVAKEDLSTHLKENKKGI